MAPGVSVIAIGTPWPVGPVNVYLIEDEPLTLIDTGQRSASALADLEAGLAARGRRVEDLERIVLTHQHIDHVGLARTLVERSGAELCGPASLDDWLTRYPESLDEEDAFAASVLRAHGAPPAADRGDHRGGQTFGGPISLATPLHDGDVLEFGGRSLRALSRPGHSPYDTVFLDSAGGLLFGGDHVLRWPSTPILAPPRDEQTRNGRPRALATYIASLRATAALELETILPGHGAPVDDHRETIRDRLARYARITERTLAAVTRRPRTAMEIAVGLKGEVPDRNAFFVLCEVLGHLDALIDDDLVVEHVDPDGLARFALT